MERSSEEQLMLVVGETKVSSGLDMFRGDTVNNMQRLELPGRRSRGPKSRYMDQINLINLIVPKGKLVLGILCCSQLQVITIQVLNDIHSSHHTQFAIEGVIWRQVICCGYC